MNNKIIGSTEGSPVVKVAALIIIIAGMIFSGHGRELLFSVENYQQFSLLVEN